MDACYEYILNFDPETTIGFEDKPKITYNNSSVIYQNKETFSFISWNKSFIIKVFN